MLHILSFGRRRGSGGGRGGGNAAVMIFYAMDCLVEQSLSKMYPAANLFPHRPIAIDEKQRQR